MTAKETLIKAIISMDESECTELLNNIMEEGQPFGIPMADNANFT